MSFLEAHLPMFVDRITLFAQAGNGGNGCDSYYRRTDKKVIPHGGDGGDGGSVIFRADNNAPGIGSFRFRQRLIAEHGVNGGPTLKSGRNAKDLIVLVPLNTRIFDREKNLLLRELVNSGDEVIVCQGGKGGTGNHGGRQAQKGTPGASLELELTVRLGADIFLVGLPNSGKSSLLNVLTNSKAKAEDYPFSTKEPELGVFDRGIYEPISLCELPSVYEASREGRGMGAGFLKHLELAKLILFVVDPVSQFAESVPEGVKLLQKLVNSQAEEFQSIPQAVVVNKMDLPEAAEKVRKQRWKPALPVFYLSAKTGEGLDELKSFFNTIFPLQQEQ